MPLPQGPFWVDTHEDIAYHCQYHGRDIVETGDVPSMITLPRLQRAGVRLICATLYAPHEGSENERRYKLHSQYHMYQEWFARYPHAFIPVRHRRDLAALAAAAPAPALCGGEAPPVGVIFLMEGLDLLNGPAEVETWFNRGVRLASLTWNGINRFASGSFGDGKALKPEGVEALREFERLGLILDLSHLNDAGIAQAFDIYHGPLCATHSNARAVAPSERNLGDAQARELAQRGGVIGLNLIASLIVYGWRKGDPEPPVAMATAHTAHFAHLLGPQHVGLGSDLDGGVYSYNSPKGIDHIDDIPALCADLVVRGWSSSEITGFMGANWWRFFERSLPE
jgi:membrane dipeptidase